MLTANKTQKRDEVLQQITKQSVVGNKKKKKKKRSIFKKKRNNKPACTSQVQVPAGKRGVNGCGAQHRTCRLVLLADKTFTGESCIY